MVTLYGELDIDTEPAARVALSTAAKARPDVVLDLSQLTFADSSVLNLMLWARTAVRPRLAGPLPTQLDRLFRVADMDVLLNVAPDLSTALNGTRPPPPSPPGSARPARP